MTIVTLLILFNGVINMISEETTEVSNVARKIEESGQFIEEYLPSSDTKLISHESLVTTENTIRKRGLATADKKYVQIKPDSNLLNTYTSESTPLVQESKDTSQKTGGRVTGTMRNFFGKHIKNIQENAFCILFFGGVTLAVVGSTALVGYKIYKAEQVLSKLRLRNSTLVLTPSKTKSSILSKAQSQANAIKQSINIKEIVHNTTELNHIVPKELITTKITGNTTVTGSNITSTTPKKLTLSKQSSNVVKNGHLNKKHMPLSNLQSTVYIVAATIAVLLLITAGILTLKVTNTDPKKDLFTDMNQYYANGSMNVSSTQPSNLNMPLNQHSKLI